MATTHEELDQRLQDFINAQKIFFVATAPDEGRINLSPKGMDTFRCLGPKAVAYQDLTGSGNETSAHLQQNGRMTIMFCAFDSNPLVLRLYGIGSVITPADGATWKGIQTYFEPMAGVRQYMVMDIETVVTSCGYGVPMFELKEERDTLRKWGEGKTQEELHRYWRRNNSVSIDGLAPFPLAPGEDDIA